MTANNFLLQSSTANLPPQYQMKPKPKISMANTAKTSNQGSKVNLIDAKSTHGTSSSKGTNQNDVINILQGQIEQK